MMHYRRLLLVAAVVLTMTMAACSDSEAPDLTVSTSVAPEEGPSTSAPAETTTTAPATTAPPETTTTAATDGDSDINIGLIALIVGVILVLGLLIGWLVGRNRDDTTVTSVPPDQSDVPPPPPEAE